MNVLWCVHVVTRIFQTLFRMSGGCVQDVGVGDHLVALQQVGQQQQQVDQVPFSWHLCV